MKQKQITLGLDIGTQYCSAGYVLDNEYHQIDFDNCPYGIPTTVCLRKTDNNEKENTAEHDGPKYVVESGTTAVETINNDYGKGGIYILSPSQSIKTLMRKGTEKVCLFNNITTLDAPFETTKLVYNFIWHVVDKITNKFKANEIDLKNYKLVVNMGYPGDDKPNSDEEKGEKESYKDKITDIVYYAFVSKICGENAEVKATSGANVEVKATSEAALAADLLKNICLTEQGPKQKVCTIDVGAGTTDLAFLEWNEKEHKYLCERQRTCNFGGKSIDLVLGKELLWKKSDGTICEDILNHAHLEPDTIAKRKKWIFTGNNEDGSCIVGYNNIDLSEKIGKYIEGTDIVSEDRNLGTLKSVFEKFINDKIKVSNNNEADTAFVLLGNSSHLPYISNMIEDTVRSKLKNTMAKVDISFLEDTLKNTPLNYINNSNFIARAAAGYENNMININCYAFSYYNETKNENGYKIISSKGNLEGYYYDTEADYMVNHKNKECDFNVDGAVYSIKILESVAMQNANVGKDFYYIKGNVPPKIGEGIAIPENNITIDYYHKPLLKEKGLRYNVGCHIDNQGKLSIYVFPNNKDKETAVKRSKFLENAEKTALAHGNNNRYNELSKL